MVMLPAIEFLAERGVSVPERSVPERWFVEHRVPMVVACTRCGMTMAVFSALVDPASGLTYCASCAGE